MSSSRLDQEEINGNSWRTSFRDIRYVLRCEITNRQLECLAWVEQGKSSNDIGGILGVSHKTVDKHILKICAALGFKSRFQAAQKARQLGLFTHLEGIKVTPRSWVALPLLEIGEP